MPGDQFVFSTPVFLAHSVTRILSVRTHSVMVPVDLRDVSIDPTKDASEPTHSFDERLQTCGLALFLPPSESLLCSRDSSGISKTYRVRIDFVELLDVIINAFYQFGGDCLTTKPLNRRAQTIPERLKRMRFLSRLQGVAIFVSERFLPGSLSAHARLIKREFEVLEHQFHMVPVEKNNWVEEKRLLTPSTDVVS